MPRRRTAEAGGVLQYSTHPDRSEERQRMVERQVRSRGVADPAVLEAMAEVPREGFVSEEAVRFAYHDAPLAIGEK